MINPAKSRLYILVIGLSIIGLALAGCSTRPATKTDSNANQRRVVRTVTPAADIPSPEELADSPCGNPNWAKLPPGTSVNGTPDEDSPDTE